MKNESTGPAGPLPVDLLTRAQQLPNSVRRSIIKELGGSIPIDWQSDEDFYTWLRDHYLQCGTRAVDDVLRRMGSKGNRRTFHAATLAWAGQEVRQRGVGDTADPVEILNLAIEHDLQEVVTIFEFAQGMPETPTLETSTRETVMAMETSTAEKDADAGSPDAVIAMARKALDRLEAEPDPDTLQALAEMVDAIVDGLERAALARNKAALAAEEQEAAKRVRADALAALLGFVALVSPERRAQLGSVSIAPHVSIEEIETTTAAVEALIAAELDSSTSSAKVEALPLADPSRRAAIVQRRAAEDAVEDSAVTLLALLAGMTDAARGEEAAEAKTELEASIDTGMKEPDDKIVEDLLSRDVEEVADEGGAPMETALPDAVLPVVADDIEEASAVRADPTIDDAVEADDDVEVQPAIVLDDWDGWVGYAIDADRLGLSTHLAAARDIAGAFDPQRGWARVVIEAALVSRGIEGNADRAASRYATMTPELLAVAPGLRLSDDAGQGAALALLAGALRSSLIAPYDGATVIAALPTGSAMNAFHGLIEFAGLGSQLRLSSIQELAPAAEQQVRDRQLQDAIEGLDQWYQTAGTRKLLYQPATVLWQQRLIPPTGAIGAPIRAILDKAPNAASMARELVEQLRDDPETFLDRMFDRQLTKSKAIWLEGAARERCLSLLAEARDRIEAWQRASAERRVSSDRLERHRASLITSFREAVTELDRLSMLEGWTGRGARLLRRAIDDLGDAVEGRRFAASSIERELDDEIALLADFPLNGRTGLRIDIDDVEPLRRAAAVLDQRVPSPREAFDRSLEIGALGSAQRLQAMLDNQSEAEQFRLEAAMEQQRTQIDIKRRQLRDKLDDLQTASTGALETSRFTEFEATLEALTSVPLDELPRATAAEIGAIGDFPEMHRRLDAFEHDLEEQRRIVALDLEKRILIKETEIGSLLNECRTLLANGDLGTLAEDLAQIEAHGVNSALMRPGDLLKPLKRLTKAVLAVDAPSVDMSKLLSAARDGVRIGRFLFDDLPPSERGDAAQLVDAWIGLRRPGQPPERTLAPLMNAIGFGSVKISASKLWRDVRRFDVRTDPIRDPRDCIIPAFGSQAGGHYTVLVAPAGKLEKCLSGFDELPDRIIAFATEWLIPKVRDQFLRRARKRTTATFALLDDASLGALAATPGRGLKHFFDLAVPAGAAHPYADTGAVTSLEMFFGRESEYAELEGPEGSCLVYGGRQLGKTALLKQIQLRNASNPDIVVIYRDIKRVGASDQSVEVWDHIAKGLSEDGTMGSDVKPGERIVETIGDWLRAKPMRRVLMLLDEADAFLEREMAEDFGIIMKMKGLMEDTGRRAKFVFAGLHNVQRFVRTPNSPMLHFGTPVNIGPLLGRDRDAARRMVFEPMAAAGIGFEHPTDAHHMLSLVGYYPSLLQTFGKTILARIDKNLARDGETARLPHMLRRSDIIESFNTTEFRTDLIDKFKATLNLDQRYELIAYTVCYRAEEDRQRGNVPNGGYSASEIRALALTYWPQGFATTPSSETFEALLDEMVGLGVLNRDGDRYTLRSARIAAMLGGRDQIETQLLEFSERPPAQKLDPMANHRPLEKGNAPLSLRQEKALIDQFLSNGHASSIAMVGCSEAVATAEQLTAGLRSLAAAREWPDPRRLTFRTISELTKVVDEMRRVAREGKPRIIICDRWPDGSEIAAILKMRELRNAAHPVRLVFLSGPADILASEISGTADVMRRFGINMIDVQPWDREAIHHWLIRHAGAGDEDVDFARMMLEYSGGFASVLDEAKPQRNVRISRDDLITRTEAAARKQLSALGLGFADTRLSDFIDRIVAYGSDAGEAEDALEAIASEIDASHGRALVRTLQRLGILQEVQKSQDVRLALNPMVAKAKINSRV